VYNYFVVDLLPTKYFLPSAPAGFVVRPHLLEELDKALTHRLTLVSAPAGAGKTTLVGDWVQSAHEKGAVIGWLALDDSDNDPGLFLNYLIASLEEGGLLIDTAVNPSSITGWVLVENAVSEFIRGILPLDREMVLILDDYHLIQNKEIHAALGFLIEHAPTRLHIVILTRSDPPMELARLRVAGQMVEVRMDALRFSEEEATKFLLMATGMKLSEKDVALLNERTEGWIAGLQMAAISLRGREDPAAFVAAFAGSHRYIFDYLLEQVLNRQPLEVKEFLLQTSVLEKLSAPLCDAVAATGGSAQGLLESLERSNLFLVPLDEERGWYRYHHLFSDLLKLMLERNHPGLSPELHRRASRWYESQEMLPEALQHALAAGDMELAAHIVSANVLVLVENDEAGPTLQMINSVSQKEMVTLPWLGIARAWILGSGHVQKSTQILDAIETSMEKAPDDYQNQRLKGHIAAARAFIFGVQGDAANTIAQARLANELLPAEEIAIRAMNLRNWGDMMVGARNDSDAMPILEQALKLALQAKKPHVAVIIYSTLATAHLFAGRLHELHRVCLDALKLADDYQRQFQRPLAATSDVYPLLARVLSEWGEDERAIDYARKGLILSERWGRPNTEALCLTYLGRVLVFGNDWEQARQVFKRADNIAQKISPAYWQEHAFFALDSMLDSIKPDPDEISRQKQRLEESGAHYSYLLKARLLLRENHFGQAIEALEQALEELDGRLSFDTVRIYGLQALAFQGLGDGKKALALLRMALQVAEPENRVATFVREGAAMEKLLQVAKLKSIFPEFTSRLLAAFESRRKHEPGPALVTDTLIEPLSEREREILHHLNGPLSTPEIAGELIVSPNTVRTHIKNIYGKLGVHGRSGAVRRARELALLE
jgi:LuxR family transcriptional regulator, maltose regulon positive regulatory protein